MDIGAEGGLHQEPCGTATLKASWGGEIGLAKRKRKEVKERVIRKETLVCHNPVRLAREWLLYLILKKCHVAFIP